MIATSPRRRIRTLGQPLGAMLACAVLMPVTLWSCSDRTIALELDLRHRDCRSGGSSLAGAASVDVVVEDLSGPTPAELARTSASVSEGALHLDALPPQGRWRISVSALDPEGRMVSTGRAVFNSLPTSGGTQSASVTLRRPQSFGSAPSSDGSCIRLRTARTGHTTTVLPDGRVWIVGGYSGSSDAVDAVTSTEFWDPRTGLVTEGPRLTLARAHHTATALGTSWKVVVAGGQNGAPGAAGSALDSAEVFDLSTGARTQTRMGVARTHHAAAAPEGSDLMVAGGYGRGLGTGGQIGTPLASTEFFDPRRGTFVAGPSLPSGRGQMGVAELAGGLVLLAGGWDGVQSFSDLFLWVTRGDRSLEWRSDWRPSLTAPRLAPAVAPLGTGRVLIAGGHASRGLLPTGPSAIVEGVALRDRTVSSLPRLSGSVSGTTRAVGLTDGRAVLWVDAGLAAGSSGASGSIEERATDDGTALGTSVSASPADGATWTRLIDGTVVRIGGWDPAQGSARADIEVYEPSATP